MDETFDTVPRDVTAAPQRSLRERGEWILARAVAWSATTSWRMAAEWRDVQPVLMRYTGHLTVLVLAVAALFIARIQFPAAATLDEFTVATKADASTPLLAVRQARLALPTPPTNRSFTGPDDGTITRVIVPHTTIPERPRSEVITYTVQAGDTVFGIAERFSLTPYTIYWANSETLEDNPHRLSLGMVLNILPVNGVYHTVSAGETVASLAEEYGVEPETLYNEWNGLKPNQLLSAGMKLVVPGGAREFIAWQLPKTVTSDGGAAVNQGRAGMCTGSFSGLPGRGWFDWPTAGRRISGWYFRDPRNPAHAGIDIGLHTGDPIYAADGGVIVFAGWWGSSGYGNLIVVDHLNGWTSWYAHLSQVNVICGQQVYAGDIIGLGGSTGWSTGPHLHLEFRKDGVPNDPLGLLP